MPNDFVSFENPVPVITAVSALIAALSAWWGYRTYLNNTRRNARDDEVKAEALVSKIEATLAEKSRNAQRQRPNSGLSTKEAESMARGLGEAFKLSPHSARVHGVAASYHAATGHATKAVRHYREAARLAPGDPDIHLSLFIHLCRMSPSEAESHLVAALSAATRKPEAFAGIGMALTIIERFREAESAYRKGLAIDANISALWYNLGSLLRRLERYEEAHAAFQMASRINPNDPEIFCNLGTACIRLGRLEDALAHLHTAVRLDPTYALPHANLAAALQHMGLGDEASAAYARYLELAKALPT